jgi:hypothetical protein
MVAESAINLPYSGSFGIATVPISVSDDDDATATNGLFYTTVREGTTGRLLACRVYHQDELEPRSLNDSMYIVMSSSHPISRHLIPKGKMAYLAWFMECLGVTHHS